jgi:putative ABC transport system permease protein
MQSLKLATRLLLKNRLFSVLNIGGLALGMSACLLILAVIRGQLGFDTFHPDGERVYRVNTEAQRKNGGTEKYASTPYPLGTALERDYAVADRVVRCIRGIKNDVKADGVTLPLSGLFTDRRSSRCSAFA